MGMAADCTFYVCQNPKCGWRWMVESPKPIYGKLPVKVEHTVCPQCGDSEVSKS